MDLLVALTIVILLIVIVRLHRREKITIPEVVEAERPRPKNSELGFRQNICLWNPNKGRCDPKSLRNTIDMCTRMRDINSDLYDPNHKNKCGLFWQHYCSDWRNERHCKKVDIEKLTPHVKQLARHRAMKVVKNSGSESFDPQLRGQQLKDESIYGIGVTYTQTLPGKKTDPRFSDRDN